jgi:hypothetical protein
MAAAGLLVAETALAGVLAAGLVYLELAQALLTHQRVVLLARMAVALARMAVLTLLAWPISDAVAAVQVAAQLFLRLAQAVLMPSLAARAAVVADPRMLLAHLEMALLEGALI